MNLRRLGHTTLALALASSFTLALGVTEASAATTVQRCATVAGNATIDPGLTNTPADQTLTARSALTGCTPSGATGGSGNMVVTIPINDGSCAKLGTAQTLRGNGRINWKNGAVSRVSLTVKTSSADPTLATISGKVTRGKFVSHLISGKIRFTAKFTGTGAPCSPTNPLKRLTFTNKINDTTRVPFRIYSA